MDMAGRSGPDAELTLRRMESDLGCKSDLWKRGPSRGNKAAFPG